MNNCVCVCLHRSPEGKAIKANCIYLPLLAYLQLNVTHCNDDDDVSGGFG